MTTREFYEFANAVFANVTDEKAPEAIAYIEKATAALDARNEKAKERAAAKRAAGDALTARMGELIGEEPMTIADIVAAIEPEYPDITPAKVVARVKRLVADETVVKGTTKVGSRKLVTYAKA
jgi:glutathione S-transferase